MLITSISGTHANNTLLDVPFGTRTAAQAAACTRVAAGAAAVGTGWDGTGHYGRPSVDVANGKSPKGNVQKGRATTTSLFGFLCWFSWGFF